MNLAVILFVGGAVIIAWIYLWSRQRRDTPAVDLDQVLQDVPAASKGDAVLVARGHGQLIYANEPARNWMDLNGGAPHLEQVAQIAQPADSFLELFAAEGQSSFQLGKRWVEASSHRIPAGDETRTVIVMRELSANTTHPEALDLNLAMGIINEIGETVNASMGVDHVLQTLLTILSKAIKFDAGEICLWDEEERALYQRGWVGDSMYVLSLAETGGKYALDEGISGWIARHRKPVLVNDRRDPAAVQPKLEETAYQSFLGVPLMLGDRFIGTAEVASIQGGRYTRGELSLIQAISKPMAVAIYNAEIYAEQVQRIEDLASLQEVTTRQAQTENADAVYVALNQRIAELLSADMCGILLYDDVTQRLIAQPPFHGMPDALARTITVSLSADSPQRDIWEKQAYWVSNDVVDEPLVEALGLRPVVNVAGITNTAWMPLQISGERIGVIAVSNKRTEGGFTTRDIQNLTVLAAQAAIVVENIRLYERERRFDAELVGLQEITHAIGALRHEGEFYSEITERIARLMRIRACGILLYDEDSRRLVSKLPFYGVDDRLVADYTIYLEPGSAMEELWNDSESWYSNRVQSDTLVFAAGLDRLAADIGIEKTLMAVLSAGGRRLGVVQVSNKLSGEDFTDNDARLLQIFATQTAAIIENARLYREAQRSADEAQGLRRVAELAGAVLTTQETFAPVLAEITKLMNSEVVFVNVLNHQTGALITYPRWVHGRELSEPFVQDIYAPNFESSVAVSHNPYLGNDVLNDERVLPSYRTIAQRMGVTKSIIVPLIVGDRTLGEIGVGNRLDGNYDQDDVAVMQVVAAQTASALDRLLLYEATGQNLTRRLEELDAISRVSNELTMTLDLDTVLGIIASEAAQATGASAGTVALLKPPHMWRVPNVPELDRRVGDTSFAEDRLADIELEAILRVTDPVIITDYEFSTLDPEPIYVRSALATPIVYLDQVVGVLHLYHREPNRFDDRAAAFLMTLSTKAALGYGNAARYREQLDRSERLRRRVDQLNRIFELGHMFHSNADPVAILEAIAFNVQQAVGFDTVVMTMVDPAQGVLARVAQAGLPVDVFEGSRRHTLPVNKLDELLKEDYRISESYLFPMEQVHNWFADGLSIFATAFEGNRSVEFSGKDGWRDGDMLLVMLRGATGNLIGVMSLDRPYDNRRPDQSTIEVLEIFAHQAATTIENIQLYLSSVRSTEQEMLINEVMEAASSTLDLNKIVESVARGILDLAPIKHLTLALADSTGSSFDVMHVTVVDADKRTVEIAKDPRMSLDRTILGRSYADGRDYLYTADSEETKLYEDLKTWKEQGLKASLVMPLLTGGETLGALHLGTDQMAHAAFEEFRPLLRRMAQLVAGAVQNARLFNQAVNLQVLNESVVESIQQGIIVLDQSGHIISMNGYMQQRYKWRDDAIGHDLFTYEPEFSTLLGDDLRDVLEEGFQRERLSQVTADATGATLVRNFYIYPLRAGKVVRGAVMLIEDVTERSRLEQAIEARASQLAALTAVSTRITSSLEREEVNILALEELAWLIGHDTMSIWRRNGSFMVLEGFNGPEGPKIYKDESVRIRFSDYELVRQMVDSQKVLVTGKQDTLESPLPEQEVAAESWMYVPLVSQGHVVGMMVLTSTEPNAYDSNSDQNVALTFASQVANALANADLFEQTFDRTNELGTLLEAAQATSLTQDLDSVFNTVVELMFGALDMDDCAIMIWDEVDNELEVQVDMNRHGLEDRITPKGTRLDLAKHPAKMAALKERDVIVVMRDDVDSPYPSEVEDLRANNDMVRILVPLVVREASIGLIQLEQTTTEKVITQQKVRLARALGAQVAVAIENARLTATMSAQFGELIIINELSRSISSTLELDDMLKVVADQVPQVTGANELYLALYDPQTEEITFPVAVAGGKPIVIPPRQLGTDEVSFIIRRGRPLNLGADYFSPDELRRSLGITNGEGDAKSYLGQPVQAGNKIFGVLALRDTERTRAFTVNDQRILEIVSSQLGVAIQNSQLYEQISNFAESLNIQVAERTQELQEERDRIDTLYQITSELAQTLDMDTLLQNALGMVARVVAADDGVIMLIDPVTDDLYSRAVLDQSMMQIDDLHERAYHPAEIIAERLLEIEQPTLRIKNLHKEKFWNKDAPGARPWRSALAVVLEANNDLQGVMVLLSRKVDTFVEAQSALIAAAAKQIAAAVDKAELYRLMRDQAERVRLLLRTEQEDAEKNTAILEGITDGVILADATGTIIRFNPAAERILQVPREDALGQPLSKLAGLYGTSLAGLTRQLETQLSYADSDLSQRVVAERLDLGDKIVSVSLSPVYTADNTLLGTVSVLRDITRDVEVDRIKSEFVSNVSHEFRTPLTPIKGYTDLLLMGAAGEVNESQSRVLTTIKENVERLTILVEDVLNISQIDSGREQLKAEMVNVDGVVDMLLNTISKRLQHQRKNLTINFTPNDPPTVIQADREKLTRLLANVIDNAFNYNRTGGSVTVDIKPEVGRDHVLISVHDTGVGIPADFRESAWRRFERHEETAVELDVAGTGLGLSIVKELVEMHGGDVWFDSEVGVGTTFFISLPVKQPDYLTIGGGSPQTA